MKRIAIIITIVIALGAGIILATSKDDNPKPASEDSATHQTASDTPAQSSNTTPSQSQATQTNKVVIQDFAFSPGTITVKKGTTVTWTNQDAVRHDVTPVSPTSEFKRSELLGKGDSYSVTFNTVGSFAYFCSPHPQMKAQIVVTE